MKRFPLFICVFACTWLFVGAAPVRAPVIATNGFYVNDYESVLFDAHRDDFFSLSKELDEKTGIQVVMLSVKSLGDLDMESYVDNVVRGWKIGGANGENGVLIFVCTGSRESSVYIGGGLEYLSEYREAEIPVGSNNLSKAIMSVYRSLVRAAYEHTGARPYQSSLEKLEDPIVENVSPIGVSSVIFLAVMALAVGRSYRVNRKYRGKYLKGYVRKRRTYSRTYNEEDEYNNDELYKIDHDDMD